MGVVIRAVRGWQSPATPPKEQRDEEHDGQNGEAIDGDYVLERLSVELADFRLSLELQLAGAILKYPHIGMLRANECGVTTALFEREDARVMYLAALYCQQSGQSENSGLVYALAIHGLKLWGFWDERARAFERGFQWSAENLADLICQSSGPGDVIEFARQLIDLDRRLRVASRLWLRLRKVLDEAGKYECRNANVKSMTKGE